MIGSNYFLLFSCFISLGFISRLKLPHLLQSLTAVLTGKHAWF